MPRVRVRSSPIAAKIAELKRVASDPEVPVEQRVEAVRLVSGRCRDGGSWLREFSKTVGVDSVVANEAMTCAALHSAASLLDGLTRTRYYKRVRRRF